MSDTPPNVPPHIEETIRAITRLESEHRRSATAFQRLVERVTAFIGRTTFVGGLSVVITLWIGGNLLALALGLPVVDPPPFNWLQGASGVSALYIAVFILTTQRRENELSDLREQLTLELVITNEQKTAKVIQLLEELRRDMPQVFDRYDPEAAAMAQPADHKVMLEATKDTQEVGLPLSEENPADVDAILNAATTPPEIVSE